MNLLDDMITAEGISQKIGNVLDDSGLDGIGRLAALILTLNEESYRIEKVNPARAHAIDAAIANLLTAQRLTALDTPPTTLTVSA